MPLSKRPQQPATDSMPTTSDKDDTMTAINPSTNLAQSRQTLAAGLLSLAKKETTSKDLNKLIEDTKSATKKALAHAREAK
jgi:hypothetical protein